MVYGKLKGAVLGIQRPDHTRTSAERALPHWLDAPPEQDWWNRYCIFGGRKCEHREMHPRAKQWGQEVLHCHISDGPDVDRDDFRGVVEEVLGRFNDVKFDYLDALPITKGYDFLLCALCQAVRSTPSAIYRVTSITPAETFVAIGMSVGLETQFEYRIPKVLLAEDLCTVPSLFSGYEVVIGRNDMEKKDHLRAFMPRVIQKVRSATWRPRPFPFIEIVSAPSDQMLAPERAEAHLDIRVVGIGGAGSNSVNRLIERGVPGMEFLAINTDSAALMLSSAQTRLRIGDRVTRRLPAGGDPDTGRQAAEASVDEIRSALQGADLVILSAGMGGGTGTGGAPVVARAAREPGVLTVGVVTLPFTFEGERRRQVAARGIERLRQEVDALFCIPNDRLLENTDEQMTQSNVFSKVDDSLLEIIRGISEPITARPAPGLPSLDVNDLRRAFSQAGLAEMTVGRASGKDRAGLAAEHALGLFPEAAISSAEWILVGLAGNPTVRLSEVDEAVGVVKTVCRPTANMRYGAVVTPSYPGELRVTIIATGLREDHYSRR